MQDSVRKPISIISAQTLCGHFQSASYFITLTFLLILLMPPLFGMVVVIFYPISFNSLHRRAAKLMLPHPSTTTEAKIQRLGLLPLREKLRFNKALLVFKACRNLAPHYFTSLFVCSNSRSSRTIILPKPRIDLFKTSFSFLGASIWNSIPAQITACSSLTCFKRQLHKWFGGNM